MIQCMVHKNAEVNVVGAESDMKCDGEIKTENKTKFDCVDPL